MSINLLEPFSGASEDARAAHRTFVEPGAAAPRIQIPSLLGMRFGCFTLAIAGIFAVLRIGFGR
jgi:hypothetical protein